MRGRKRSRYSTSWVRDGLLFLIDERLLNAPSGLFPSEYIKRHYCCGSYDSFPGRTEKNNYIVAETGFGTFAGRPITSFPTNPSWGLLHCPRSRVMEIVFAAAIMPPSSHCHPSSLHHTCDMQFRLYRHCTVYNAILWRYWEILRP